MSHIFQSKYMPKARDRIGEGDGTPLQYSCLENPMGGGARWAAVHGVTKSRTWLSDFTFTFHFRALEKEMATHSGVLAWRILGTGEPGGLPSLGSHRIGHDWSDLAAAGMLINLKITSSNMWQHSILEFIYRMLCFKTTAMSVDYRNWVLKNGVQNN